MRLDIIGDKVETQPELLVRGSREKPGRKGRKSREMGVKREEGERKTGISKVLGAVDLTRSHHPPGHELPLALECRRVLDRQVWCVELCGSEDS